MTETRQKIPALGWTYILLTMISCLSIYDSSRLTKLKAAHILFIGIAFVHLALSFKRENIKVSWDFLKKYSLYLAILADVSFFIFTANHSETALVKTGTIKVIYQVITVLTAVGAVYLFGERAVDYTFYGFVAFNLLSILLAAKDTGSVGEIFSSIQHFITSGGDARGFMKHLELHDATFSFGIFLIHYFMCNLRNKSVRKHFYVAAAFFLLGYKRIGIGAALFSILIYIVLLNGSKSRAVAFGRVFLWGFMISGFLFVVMVRYGVFQEIMNELRIDMSGRQNLYEYMQNFYSISPLFRGYGLESIKFILAQAGDLKVNETYIARLSAVHNDYLRMYVEMGFWGFLLWEGYMFVWLPEKLKHYGKETYISYVAVTLYLAFTYFTDNTAMFFLVSIVYRLVPMFFALRERKEAAV